MVLTLRSSAIAHALIIEGGRGRENFAREFRARAIWILWKPSKKLSGYATDCYTSILASSLCTGSQSSHHHINSVDVPRGILVGGARLLRAI